MYETPYHVRSKCVLVGLRNVKIFLVSVCCLDVNVSSLTVPRSFISSDLPSVIMNLTRVLLVYLTLFFSHTPWATCSLNLLLATWATIFFSLVAKFFKVSFNYLLYCSSLHWFFLKKLPYALVRLSTGRFTLYLSNFDLMLRVIDILILLYNIHMYFIS